MHGNLEPPIATACQDGMELHTYVFKRSDMHQQHAVKQLGKLSARVWQYTSISS